MSRPSGLIRRCSAACTPTATAWLARCTNIALKSQQPPSSRPGAGGFFIWFGRLCFPRPLKEVENGFSRTYLDDLFRLLSMLIGWRTNQRSQSPNVLPVRVGTEQSVIAET